MRKAVTVEGAKKKNGGKKNSAETVPRRSRPSGETPGWGRGRSGGSGTAAFKSLHPTDRDGADAASSLQIKPQAEGRGRKERKKHILYFHLGLFDWLFSASDC